MQIYLVGGAVRDELLQQPVKDRDYLVVGTTPEKMLALGYEQVGKDFPVFLHPKTKAEYALARTERKTGAGYSGFECFSAPDVTLEQDLLRRDLTINAIAKDPEGKLYDPHQGIKDLQARVLRHVSPAFVEDPLRVLRVARFAARFASLGFSVAPETLELMRIISHSGELTSLTPERIWLEMDKALATQSPQVFFDVLRQCGALQALLPEIAVLFGVPQPEKWHPEIDTGVHTLMTLQQAARLTEDKSVRFAALVHDLGKGLTPKELWPKHHAHDCKGLTPIRELCQRLKIPNEYRELALLSCEWHQNCHNALELKAKTIVNLFDKADIWRKPERLNKLLTVCMADSRGRAGFENTDYPHADFLIDCYQVAAQVDIRGIISAGFQGAEIREQLRKLRIAAIKECRQKWSHQS